MLMEVISTTHVTKYFKLKDVVGKKVISASGQVVGTVKDIAYDMNRVIGLMVGDVLIGKEYIDTMNADSVILKVNPVTSLIGKLVFDKDGKKLGKVIKTNRATTANDFTDVMVKKNTFTRAVKITKAEMEVVGKNIILRVSK